jgi:hypothetical protein
MRGAVGLLMAVVADQNRFISAEARTLIIFHAGGMAAIMQLINGPLTPHVLRLCGLMDSTDKATVIADVHQRVAKKTKDELRKYMEDEETKVLFSLAVESQVSKMVFPPELEKDPSADGDSGLTPAPSEDSAPQALPRASTSTKVNKNQLRTFRESLLRVVKQVYWELCDDGVIPRKHAATKVLLDSADRAMMDSAEEDGLADWEAVKKGMQIGLYSTEEEYRTRTNAWQVVFDFEHYQQRGIMTALVFVYAHEKALNAVRAFRAGDTDECLECKILIQEVEEQNKKAMTHVESLDKDCVTLEVSKMLARKLLHFQATQVHDLASRGLITDSHASELEHVLHKSARGLLRLKMEQAAGFMHNPMGLVTAPLGLAGQVGSGVMGVASDTLGPILGFFRSQRRPRRSESESGSASEQQ